MPHHCGRPSWAQQTWSHTLGCGEHFKLHTPFAWAPLGPLACAARKGQEALPSLAIHVALRTGSRKRKYPCRLLWYKSAFPPCQRCIGTRISAAMALTRAGEHTIPRPERDESRAAPPLRYPDSWSKMQECCVNWAFELSDILLHLMQPRSP